MVRRAVGEDLRLVLQPAKGARVQYAVPIALEQVAIRVLWLCVPAATRLFNAERIRRSHLPILNFDNEFGDWHTENNGHQASDAPISCVRPIKKPPKRPVTARLELSRLAGVFLGELYFG
jgi:hypothetical protein